MQNIIIISCKWYINTRYHLAIKFSYHSTFLKNEVISQQYFKKSMEIVYVYTKKRAEFGRQCNFSDRPAELHVDVPSDLSFTKEFIERDPCDNAIQNVQEMSEHEV